MISEYSQYIEGEHDQRLRYDIYDTVIVDRVVCFFPFVMTLNSTIDNLPPRLQGCRKKRKKEGRYHFTQISLSRPKYYPEREITLIIHPQTPS